ncbi:hypothetical protein, partial [Phocaeicola sp.]
MFHSISKHKLQADHIRTKPNGDKKETRGCVKTLAQPFFMRKAQTFPSPDFVITESLCNFRHKIFRYGKVTFSS